MSEKKQDITFEKIEQFLSNQRQFWYPQSRIRYKRTSSYSSFDDMLKREILYTNYIAEEPLTCLECRFSPNGKQLDIHFLYKNGKNGIALPKESLLDAMKRSSTVSNIRFYTKEDQITDNVNQMLHDIANRKAKDKGFGKVTINNSFQGNIQYYNKNCTILGYNDNLQLIWLTVFEIEDEDSAGIFRDDPKFRDWIQPILTTWLQELRPIQFEWSLQNGNSILEIIKQVSEIGVDASSEEEPHVFRWRSENFTTQCKSSSILPTQDIEDIIKNSGLAIPNDSKLVGISAYGENTPTPCIMATYIHILPDTEFIPSAKTPSLHQNPGTIIVEGDFCIFYIDPEKKRVISEYRKWRTIK